MHTLIVTFELAGISEADFYRTCDAEAPAFAAIPGLVGKTWLADPASNTYGGVYTFRERAELDDYLASPLFAGLQSSAGLGNFTARSFAVLEGPSRITSGLPLQAV